MEKRPNIFKPGIKKPINNNKKAYYSFIEEEIPTNNKQTRKLDPVEKLNELMNKDGYIFNKNVIITTNDNTYDTRIAGKIGEKIITLTGESINIKEIKEIREK